MPIVSIIGSIQAAEAMKLITGHTEMLHRGLITADAWNFEVREIDLSTLSDRSGCPACGRLDFEFLRGSRRQVTTTLCGRNAVQISRSSSSGRVDFRALAARLGPLGQVAFNDFLLRFRVEAYDITVFQDARSIIRGTSDPATARALYARYIGA
jgi:hypothetical protein